ncbi:unnamed protein product [Chrysodeixis includens]|uniref:Uncharacterized protein n=1 Tax=Chrysodeixis includens TaxID=689277 RepID=A0A9N8Q0N5_CHRIL|nr:unnamed protein product [Chrysodeixis includens]
MDGAEPTTAMSVEGQRCLFVVVLLIHTVTGAGEGSSSPPPLSSVKPPGDQNELTVTFPPLEDLYGNTPEKHFGTENNTVVTSQTGSTALLPCVIRNIGDGIVSWIRRKDYHLLTVGLTTYSSDQRFQAIHLQHSEPDERPERDQSQHSHFRAFQNTEAVIFNSKQHTTFENSVHPVRIELETFDLAVL